ncbi:MAG: PKD domain-containing protein [Bacteroidetes bacterium]|nr:PKD domain-containing protein [Bacteroidota bacterium]
MIKQKLFTFILIGFLAGVYTPTQGQNTTSAKDYSQYPYWIEMMQDQSVNFYEVQEAFEAYWENREITKGSGWKPFKRWEWWQERHIYPNGTRHEADKIFNAYMGYIQKNPQAKSSNGEWTNLGPIFVPSKGYEGLGRINAIAFHPTDPDIVYIGAPAGGCWIYDGTTGGWSSTTDGLPSLGVSAIVVDWSNPDKIYIGTGDRDAGDALGLGVFRSTDGGETWEVWNNGMGNRTVGRMIQHPVNPDILYAATAGGIYKTTDGGANWVYKANGGTKEIVFKPNDPSTLYAGGNGKFYKSTDNGETWVQITNGIEAGSRSVIAVTPANPEVVYCLLSNGDSYKGIWKSTNSGESFTMMSNSPNIMSWGCNGGDGGQAWYDLDVAVDPNDEDVIFAGGVNCFKSEDGGVTWDISSHWWGDCNVPAVHADLHVLEYNPLNDRLYAGNDGGIYFTANGGSSWPEITDGLPISQVYRIGQSATNVDKVINGYQDNGSSTYFGNNVWMTTGGGDGMECAIDYTNDQITYHTIYYGDIYRKYNNGSQHQVAGQGVHGMTESGGWVTPFCLHEGDPNIMFVGMKNIWRAEGVTTNSFTWKVITEGGGGDIDVVEHAPADHNLFYYARNQQLYRSDNVMDDQPEWINLSGFIPGTGNVLDIESHPFDPDVVYASRSGKVFVSQNRGMNWEDITGSLPDININSIAFYLNSMDGIYVGSDAGVYYRDAHMDDWVMFSNGLPIDASINEIEIYHNPENPEEDVIRAGTYGRGLWSSPVWHDAPVAAFEAEETNIPVGCPVDFYDLSSGVPTSWEWTFEGGTPAVSTDKNPEGIVYTTEGTFSVTLTVSNAEGTDTETINGYMEISETAVPDVYFIASDSITCSETAILFTDMSSNCPTGWEWSFDPGTVSFINGTNQNSQNPEVEFVNTGAYTVSLTVTNNAGNNSLVKEDYINIGGISIPFGDDFESGSLTSKSWNIENPDFDKTWGVTDVAGNGSTKAAWLNFYDYIVPPGQRDRMITPVLDLSLYTDAYLMFDYAYAKRHTNITDSLIVKISDDCGESWTRIFEGGEDGDGSFATHELMVDPFYPEISGDWCGSGWGAECVFLDLTNWAGQGNIQVMFETYNYFGNNLFVDNVDISTFTGIADHIKDANVRIFPNPTTGNVNIVIPNKLGHVDVSIINPQGAIVEYFDIAESGIVTTNLSKHGKGIYFIRVTGDSGTQTGKVVVH